MQATITYLLTEQAQRAQMAATGQPVARKRTITVDVPAEDLQYYPVDSDGNIAVDLANGTHIVGHRVSTGCFAAPPSVPDLVRNAIEEEQVAKRDQSAKLEKQLTQQLAAVEQFLSDPTKRADVSSGYTYIGGTRIDSTTNEYHLACPRWPELIAEAKRRDMSDAESRKAKEAEERAEKAEKEAEKAAKEQAKLDYLHAWIAEHGTDSQKARSADNLLCRDEAITALADAAFAPLVEAIRYTNDSRPVPDCTCEECESEDCGIKRSVEDGADCLCESQYATYTRIREAMPDAVYVLRTHSAVHDCDHSPNCKTGENYGCMVKATVGPFILQREYEL